MKVPLWLGKLFCFFLGHAKPARGEWLEIEVHDHKAIHIRHHYALCPSCGGILESDKQTTRWGQ